MYDVYSTHEPVYRNQSNYSCYFQFSSLQPSVLGQSEMVKESHRCWEELMNLWIATVPFTR